MFTFEGLIFVMRTHINYLLLLFCQELNMKALCVIIVINNQFLAYGGNAQIVSIMIFAQFVTMLINIICGIAFIELLYQGANGKKFKK